MNDLRRTDLASELDLSDTHDIDKRQKKYGNVEVNSVEILTDGAAKRLGKPRGKYITVEIGKIWLASDSDFDNAAAVISENLSLLASELCGEMPHSIFTVGLGNRKITADALGDEVVGLITATRHIKTNNSALFGMLGGREISAIAPGVLGQTGIEAAEIVHGVCKQISPELVIAIDSLCARSTERLATTVQLGSSGISPGSGIGNQRRSIDKSTLGIPVIAIGVPTVVDSATLVMDALEEAQITEPDERLIKVLSNRRGFYVTPKESDTIVREVARLIARSIVLSFGGI